MPESIPNNWRLISERLASYIAVGLAHQRLAEAARHAAVDRAQILIEVASSDGFPEVARLIKINDSRAPYCRSRGAGGVARTAR